MAAPLKSKYTKKPTPQLYSFMMSPVLRPLQTTVFTSSDPGH